MKSYKDLLTCELNKNPERLDYIKLEVLRILLSQLIYSFIYEQGLSKWKVITSLRISPVTLRQALNGDIRKSERELLHLADRALRFAKSLK